MSEAVVALIVIGALMALTGCAAVSVLAMKCGRNGGAWFFAALFFTPIMALLMLIALGVFRVAVVTSVEAERSRAPAKLNEVQALAEERQARQDEQKRKETMAEALQRKRSGA